jgi:hypothetical protein
MKYGKLDILTEVFVHNTFYNYALRIQFVYPLAAKEPLLAVPNDSDAVRSIAINKVGSHQFLENMYFSRAQMLPRATHHKSPPLLRARIITARVCKTSESHKSAAIYTVKAA